VAKDLEEGKLQARDNRILLKQLDFQHGRIQKKDSLIANLMAAEGRYTANAALWEEEREMVARREEALRKTIRTANRRAVGLSVISLLLLTITLIK
jgi:hypothetical protein